MFPSPNLLSTLPSSSSSSSDPSSPSTLFSPPTLGQRFDRWRGSTIQHDLRAYAPTLEAIARLEPDLERRTDAALASRTRELAALVCQDTPLDELLPEVFALVREASRRVLDQRPYEVQLAAGIALHQGHVVEMQTGEGKTLAAVAPATLNALTGRSVHVLTFNDYLAQRDAEWMGPVYGLLGLSTDWVAEGRSRAERHTAYRADVTYVTAQQAGFDHLRDQLATSPGEQVQRPFHYAIVDEADSLLVDEARIPLVLAGSVERESSHAPVLAELVTGLVADQHFVIEEQGRNVELLEAGFDRTEEVLGCGNLLAEENYRLFTELNCALHAQVLLRRDVDYLVRDGKIDLVDELTGRVAKDRHWPDGLQAALEAKEGLERRPDGRILGTISVQHLLCSYERLAGMTGTAQEAAPELHDVYGLDVVVIPTHRPSIRLDHPDRVFTHVEAKEQALVEEIRQVQASGRPILVGTSSVEESERLATRLADAGVACEILNARNDALEAEIVSRAGSLGAVTISTNMAGRGTDVRLGGVDGANHRRVVELGGLYVLGTHRSESRRIDRQLMGRAGRQGDPGASRFFLSLEDELLERYDVRSLIPEGLFPTRQAEPIESSVVDREIARLQRIVEGQSFEIRKTLWRYSAPIEDQHKRFQARRQQLLGERGPESWCRDPRAAPLLAAVGEAKVREAETRVTLFHRDRVWSEHLARIASLREGIHLMGLGGEDPLTVFRLRTAEAFRDLEDEVATAVDAALDGLEVAGDTLDLGSLGIQGPSSTWTYVVNDDPFRHQLGRMLTGPGGASMAIGAALTAAPMFLLWLVVERLRRKRPSRRE